MSRQLVSVVVPALNAEHTLARALDSILGQDYRPIEAIVVDDGSRDATAETASRYDDPAVRLIRHPHSRGASAARNSGIAAASGDIVAFLDADDEWLPGKLTQQVELLQSDPSLVFVACGALLISPSGENTGPLFGGQIPKAGPRAWPGLLARNTVATSTVVAWRGILLAEEGFDVRLTVAEDQDLWIRLALRGSLGYLDAPLVRMYVIPDSLSYVGSGRSFRQQIEFTLPMIERHVAANRENLSRREVRRALGERYGRIGRAAYSYGIHAGGLRFIVRATLLGFEPFQNLLFLIGAAPPARRLKHLVQPKRR